MVVTFVIRPFYIIKFRVFACIAIDKVTVTLQRFKKLWQSLKQKK